MLRRFSVFSLAFLLCLSLFPARALAWDVIPKGVLYQGDVEGSNYGAVVSAYNQFDAACYVLGKDPNTISASIKEKLSDANYGGKFYEYSQYFFTQSGALEDVPGWVPTYVVMISELGDLMLSDYQSVWYVSTTKALHDAALVDFKRVLYGEDLSGGGSGSGGGSAASSYQMLKIPSYRSSTYWMWAGNSKVVFDNAPSTATIKFNESSRAALQSVLDDGYDVVIWEDFTNSNTTGYKNLKCRVYGHGGTLVNSSNLLSFVNNTSANLGEKGCGISYSTSLVGGSVVYDASFSINGSRYAFNPGNNVQFGWSEWGSSYRFWGAYYLIIYSDGSTSGDPVVPPPSGTWPEPSAPAVPVAPVLPEPVTPTVETPVSPTVPTPVWPDVTINIEPDPTPGTTPSGLDYTELLTRINDNLISIDSFARAINSNLNSLRSDLLAEFNGVIDSLRNIYNYLLTIDSVLETHCTHLRNKIEQSAVFIANYMRTLIKWLADQLDFDDLTNVEAPDNSLLTTINEKLGGGTYEPNPIKDESAYYEWLDDLWDRFLLGDNWQSSMGSISGSFSELKTRFPFSVPWDIVALFRLFVHDPVTPVFDLPLYFSSDGSTPVHVDLSPWDSVASLVRPMIFVIFALKLALLSRDLLGGLGADKGGL